MRRVIFNQKGGVGKTTIACNLAALSAAAGMRTLVVDLDPQSNSTQYLLGEAANSLEVTLADFYKETLSFTFFPKSMKEFVYATPIENLSILPSHQDLGEMMHRLESRYKISKLRDALEELENFDAVYFDTPPALNFYTLSALIAANRCLIPFDCDDFSRNALYRLMERVQEIRQDHNPQLEVEGIIVNHFQPRAKLPKQLVDELTEEGLPILSSHLSHSVVIRESHHKAAPLINYAPTHKVSLEYQKLFQELDSSKNKSECFGVRLGRAVLEHV